MRLKLSLVPIVALATSISSGIAAAQAPSVVAHTVDVSRGRASLELQLSNDQVVDVTLQGGEVEINGNAAGRYTRGGDLENGWRTLLDSVSSLNTNEALAATRKWARSHAIKGPDAPALQAIGGAVTSLTAVPAEAVAHVPEAPPEPDEPAQAGDVPPAPGRHPGAVTTTERSAFLGVGPTAAGLLGAFVALASIAFGMISFAPRQLDVVSETLQQSFIRSFFAGLFAQPLILPALAVLILALILTVVGILVIPVAIIAFGLALCAAVVGGYIAAARALGEIYLRRRMARGATVSADPTYRAIVVGLAGLLMIWAPFALLGWIPGVGIALLVAAIIFTWLMATVGLGATILSRAGLRGTFGRRMNPQMSGELSWSTVDEIAPSKRGEGSVR